MNIKEIAEKLRDKLKKYEDFQGLYLYGSRIKGCHTESSDVDILAIFNKKLDYNATDKVYDDIISVELEHDAVIDFHSMTLYDLKLNVLFFKEVQKGFYYGR